MGQGSPSGDAAVESGRADPRGAIAHDGLSRAISVNDGGKLPSFEKAVAAFADTIARRKEFAGSNATEIEAVSDYLIAVHARMPDYLRALFRLLTLIFDAWPYLAAGRPFHRLDLPGRIAQIEAWERSRLEVRRRLIEFYASLALFCLYSERYGRDYRHDG